MTYPKDKENIIFQMSISKAKIIPIIFFEIIACVAFLLAIIIWSKFDFVIYDYILYFFVYLIAFIIALACGISSTSKNAVAKFTKESVIVRRIRYSLKLYIRHYVVTNSKRYKTIIIIFSDNKRAKIKAKTDYVEKFIEKFEIVLEEKFPPAKKTEESPTKIEQINEQVKQEQVVDVDAIKNEILQQVMQDIKDTNEIKVKKEPIKLTFEEKIKNATRKANCYFLKSSLMDSEYEKIFYIILSKLINKEDYIIMPHVSLREVFSVVGDNFENLEYLSTHHIDFIIYENYEYKPVVAIEINGTSHNEDRQKVSDTFKKAIFEKYGVHYVTIQNDLVDDIEYVRSLLVDITEYSLYCRHDDRNKKMFKIDERTYKCLECKKIYTYRPLVNL